VAQYLETQVPTPARQLTTDDWAPGYSPITSSVNLGIKAIIGLMAASQIATILGDSADASSWSDAATNNVGPWISLSTDANAGDYLNVAQGSAGTWLSLYNAYYEAVIGVSLVPDQVAAEQAAFYLSKLTTYGMPLQTNAGDITKVAWMFYLPAWLNGFPIAEQLMSRNVAYINDTTSLVPYGDRYHTSTGVEISGIQAHPTLGAVYALLAADVTLPSGTGSTPPATGTTVVTPPAPPMAVKVTATTTPRPMLTIFISDGVLTLAGKDVSIRVHAAKGARCHGTLELVYTREVTVAHHRRRRVSTVIGHAKYSVPAGDSHTVKVKLSPAGLSLLRRAKHERLAIVVKATVVGGMSASKRASLRERHAR
jgi:hypothetical protein